MKSLIVARFRHQKPELDIVIGMMSDAFPHTTGETTRQIQCSVSLCTRIVSTTDNPLRSGTIWLNMNSQTWNVQWVVLTIASSCTTVVTIRVL